jgi:hypothetical protein
MAPLGRGGSKLKAVIGGRLSRVKHPPRPPCGDVMGALERSTEYTRHRCTHLGSRPT